MILGFPDINVCLSVVSYPLCLCPDPQCCLQSHGPYTGGGTGSHLQDRPCPVGVQPRQIAANGRGRYDKGIIRRGGKYVEVVCVREVVCV